MRVLIVDDDAIVLESCKRILEADGIDVDTAEDVLKAQAVLETAAPFDLMLTDIKMPGKDGFHLIQAAKEKFSGTAVLMMTGYLIPETIQKGRDMGADGFIAKPFTPEELIASVHSVLSTAGMKRGGGVGGSRELS